MTGPTGPTYPAVPAGPDPAHVSVQPYYVRDFQDWAVEQERMNHIQALYTVGEYAAFVLMWHLEDHLNGLVARCSSCYVSAGKIAEAYGQVTKNRCLTCFGTTFEGGYKAFIVRPTIWSDTDEDEKYDRRGVVNPNDVSIETTPDFRIRQNDYCFRQDGTRWQMRVPQRVTLRTGFTHPLQSTTNLTYNHQRASQEDPDSVAFQIPPDTATLRTVLSRGARFPEDWADIEVIRAPLIPVGE